MNVEWTDHARALLDEQLAIICDELSAEDASRWFGKLKSAIDVIETFPEAYPLSRVPALAAEGIRTISVKKYNVYYVIGESACHIISLRRGAMNIQTIFDL